MMKNAIKLENLDLGIKISIFWLKFQILPTFLPEYAYSFTDFREISAFFQENVRFLSLKLNFWPNFKQIFEIFMTFLPEYAYS